MTMLTGNTLVDSFLRSLDQRIDDPDTDEDARARLVAMRPMVRMKILADPHGFEEYLQGWLVVHRLGIPRG